MNNSRKALLLFGTCFLVSACSDPSDNGLNSNSGVADNPPSPPVSVPQNTPATPGAGETPVADTTTDAGGAPGAGETPVADTTTDAGGETGAGETPVTDTTTDAGGETGAGETPVADTTTDAGGETGAGETPVADTTTDAGETPVAVAPTDTDADGVPGSDTSVGSDTVPDSPSGQVVGDPTSSETPVATGAPSGPTLAPVSVSGADTASGPQDDSPTTTESASLVGPFIKDPARPPGPPSVPTGLTLLLQSNNWLKFSWAPSVDDQSISAYEVYRDGVLISTVRGDTGYEHDYRRWLSTSIIDCNYTRYANCVDQSLQPVPGSSYAYSVVAVDNEGMRSERSAEAIYTFPANSQSMVDLAGYELVFNEEFDGNSLDISRWKTALPWGPDQIINGELQYFTNIFAQDPIDHNPFQFTGETLQITGTPTPPALLAQANNQPYLSGVITTADYFEMTYGYVEMSAKLASGQGLLSTFYLFNQGFYKNKPEIDIVEYISQRPDKAYQTYHYYDSNRARFSGGEKHSSPTMEYQASMDLSADFQRFSVLWEPELIIWYVNDVEVQRVTGARVSDEPMNIVAQLVVGSDWIGTPDASSIPAILEIDYIKAWQKLP